MSLRKHLACLFAAALLTLAALPAAASATVYCVDTTPGELGDNDAIDPSCETPAETLSSAVESAAASAEADTILIGPGDYTLAANAGGSEVYYYTSKAGNSVLVRGLGEPHLTMGGTEGMQTGIALSGPAGTGIEDLRLTIPANADGSGDIGIFLNGAAEARRVTVDGPEATNARGIHLYGTTTVSASVVDLPVEAAPSNAGISSTTGATAAIVDSTIRATTGAVTSGSTVTFERSTIEAKTGSSTDAGTIVFRDSLIDLGTVPSAIGVKLANENAGSSAMHGVIEGTTIVGGGAGSAGIRVQADNGTESADAIVDSTVISGPVYPLQVWADNGREAEVTASYSNYDSNLSLKADKDGTGEAGTMEYVPSEVTELEPGFVDAAAGDYHLAPGSALADRGDPAAPPAEELDIDGQPRAVSAACPSAAGRRDIGADEIVPTCTEPEAEGEAPAPEGEGTDPGTQAPTPSPPDTAIRGKRRIVTAKARVRVGFRLVSSEEGARFRCKVDRQRFRSCGSRIALFLRPGRHRIVAKAVGAAGPDPTPAVRYVKIVRKQPAR